MLLDSNIIIYSVQPEFEKILEFLSSKEDSLSVSIISKIEVLGYNKLTNFDKENFLSFFDKIQSFGVNDEIVNIAIDLKQQQKMSLGDAIIAATAIYKKIPLLTNNTDDFKHIENLVLISLNDIIGGNKEAVIS
ncbi:MAG: type II toxin-antitoxin system VapC family toxin [Chitinophagales bacterium]